MNVSKSITTRTKTYPAAQPAAINTQARPLIALSIGIALLAGWGVWLVYQTLTGAVTPLTIIYAINEPVPTSFGTFIISEADDLTGLTSQDLAGVTHGIQNLVLADAAQIQLTFAMINRTGQALSISPDQFELLNLQSGERVQLTGSSIHQGQLQPRSNIEATLSFVVPRDGSTYKLLFHDPNGQVVQVDLGSVDQVSAETLLHLHDH